MVLPSTGPISFANLQTEFGGNNPISMHEYYARSYTKPTVVGVAHASLNSGTSANITLPGGTQSGDKVYLHIVYENTTASRPTITDFTIETSFNGTKEGTDFTEVFASATIPLSTGSTITIPNSTPVNFGGFVASIIVIRGVDSYGINPNLPVVPSGGSYSVVKATYATSLCSTVSILPDELLVVMLGHDGQSNQTFTAWTSSGAGNTYNYLSADGAVIGRAAQINTITTTGTSTLTLSNPTGSSGGTPFVFFTVKGATTLPSPTNSNLTIPNLQNLPQSNTQASLSNFRGKEAVTVTPIGSFTAGADSYQSFSLASFVGYQYLNIVIGVNMAAASAILNATDRSWEIRHLGFFGDTYLRSDTEKVFDSEAVTDGDDHRTVYLIKQLGIIATGDTVRIYWTNGSGGVPNREQHITVYAISGVPNLSVYDINRLVGSTGDGSVTASGNGRCITILQATTNDGSAPTAISNATLGGVSSRHASYYNITDASSTIHTTSGLPANGFGQFVAVSFAY